MVSRDLGSSAKVAEAIPAGTSLAGAATVVGTEVDKGTARYGYFAIAFEGTALTADLTITLEDSVTSGGSFTAVTGDANGLSALVLSGGTLPADGQIVVIQADLDQTEQFIRLRIVSAGAGGGPQLLGCTVHLTALDDTFPLASDETPVSERTVPDLDLF